VKSLLLIDLSVIYWRSWHATADQEVSAAFDATVGKVHQLKEGYDFVAVCCDSPPYERSKLLAGYKKNREAAPPLALEQFARVKDRLRADGLLLWESPGFEADDVIAWATHEAFSIPANVTIASSDKDLMCLVTDDPVAWVAQLQPFDNKRYDRTAVVEKFGVAPEQMPDFLALVGDSSDNIPGVKGIGPVNAAKLLMQYDTLEGIIAAAASIDGAVGKAILANVEQVRLGRKVVELRRDVPLNFAELFVERKPAPLPTHADWDDDDDAPESKPPQQQLAVTPPGTTAMVVRPAEWSLQLEPSSPNSAWKVARAFCESRMFQKLGGPEAHFMAIMRGRALGLDAATSCASFHNIKNRLTLHAEIILGLVMRSGKAEFFECVETSDERATWVTKRVGARNEISVTWDMDRALRAALVEKRGDRYVGKSSTGEPSNWDKYPRTMLRWRAGTELAHAIYPDVVTGLVAPDEVDE
jgi:5'-3' exonuclease